MRRTLKRCFCLLIRFLACVLLLCQCATTRKLDEGQSLLVKHKISVDSRKIGVDDMYNYLKPKPNRSVLGFHTRLYFYNAFKDSQGKFGTWMREIVGEPPVLFDSAAVAKNNEQLRLFLNELGYYRASVSSTTRQRFWNAKKSVVLYKATTGELFTVSRVAYQCADSSIAALLDSRRHAAKIKEGKPFSILLLQDEQARIVSMLNNRGYYAFSKENVVFAADTTHGPDSVSLVISVKKTSETSLKLHKIKETVVTQGEKLQRHIGPWQDNRQPAPKAEDKSTYIKDETVQLANFVEEDALYRSYNTKRTHQILGSYPICKLVNIEFTQSKEQADADTVSLDCEINIVPGKKQSVSFEIEGTNTSGDWGAEFDMSYINRNVFHGAEYLTLKLKLSAENNNVLRSGKNDARNFFNSQEYGIAVDFTTPKFLIPFVAPKYNKRFRAKSNCHVEYDFLQTVDYTRPITDVNFGYIWYGNRFLTYNLNPINISYIRYYNISNRFNTFINSRNYYKYSYEDYLVLGNSFSLVYYNKRNLETRDYQYFKLGVETSGNLMYALCEAANAKKNSTGQYEAFSLPFAQYAKGDVDFRYYDVVSQSTTFVYRIFAGLAVPYLNTSGLPSVKKYYSGGANSMRAWECRSLGLGSYTDTTTSFKYYLGDVKLELNFESRFHLFWIIDGAFFVDAGNIWSINNNELQGANFSIKNFYKNLAVGTGLGLRFDFSFLVFRCDVGMKLREANTITNTNSHLIIGNRKLTGDDFNLNIGIGYPF